eukprot:SAG22_NODE_5198_length_1063_cov_1.637967_1_plen_73_part_10
MQVWLLVILVWHTPGIVSVNEGGLTFIFFPILVIIAFLADKGYCGGKANKAAAINSFSEDTTGDGVLDTKTTF